MRKTLICSVAMFAIGFFVGNSTKQKPQRRNSPSANAVQLEIGEPISISSNGFQDGLNYFRSLRVEKIINLDGSANTATPHANEQRQEWILQVGTGEERRAVILVQP